MLKNTVAYNVVDDFIRLAVVASEIGEILWKFELDTVQFKVIQDRRSWCQSKAHMQLPITH